MVLINRKNATTANKSNGRHHFVMMSGKTFLHKVSLRHYICLFRRTWVQTNKVEIYLTYHFAALSMLLLMLLVLLMLLL